MEKIIAIQEYTENYKEGYKITTSNQDIKLLIDNGQCCCESWGYFLTEDDTYKFIGTNILEIKLTDELNKGVDLNGKIDEWLIDKNGQLNMYDGGCMFVDIVTDKGTLQFVAYNEHNGYYGHNACIISTQLNYDTWL